MIIFTIVICIKIKKFIYIITNTKFKTYCKNIISNVWENLFCIKHFIVNAKLDECGKIAK